MNNVDQQVYLFIFPSDSFNLALWFSLFFTFRFLFLYLCPDASSDYRIFLGTGCSFRDRLGHDHLSVAVRLDSHSFCVRLLVPVHLGPKRLHSHCHVQYHLRYLNLFSKLKFCSRLTESLIIIHQWTRISKTALVVDLVILYVSRLNDGIAFQKAACATLEKIS